MRDVGDELLLLVEGLLQLRDHTVERAREPASNKPGGAFQWWIDMQFFVVSLQRLRTAAQLMSRVAPYKEDVLAALRQFNEDVPDIAFLRNVGEHIDDYSLDQGMDPSVEPPSQAVGKYDGTTYHWLDRELDAEQALASSRELVAQLHAIRKREEDPPLRLHDLRHTFGTLGVQVWPLRHLQAYMGHANIATTEGYAHHVPKRNAAAALTRFVEAESEQIDSEKTPA